jgi:CRP-like cAMP-binding protein
MQTNQEAFLKVISRYSQIPEEQKALLTEMVKHQRLSKQEYFIRAEEKPQKFAYVNKGIFRVYCIAEDGQEKTMSFRFEDQFIAPYTPFLYEQPVWYSIKALTVCDIYYISVSDYRRLLDGHVCWSELEQNYIASYLGITPVSLSRLKSQVDK